MAITRSRAPITNREQAIASLATGGAVVANFIRPVISSGRDSIPWKRNLILCITVNDLKSNKEIIIV